MSADRRAVPFAVPLLFGVTSFVSMIGRGRLTPIAGPDILQLIGTGMCFGVALVGVILLVRAKRARSGGSSDDGVRYGISAPVETHTRDESDAIRLLSTDEEVAIDWADRKPKK